MNRVDGLEGEEREVMVMWVVGWKEEGEMGLVKEVGGMKVGMNVMVVDVNGGGWKVEREGGVMMDGEKREEVVEGLGKEIVSMLERVDGGEERGEEMVGY